MIAILTPEQMKAADAHAIRRCRIPSDQLMEQAGLQVVQTIKQRHKKIRGTSVLVLCGKGNNGGDGLVAARLLHHQQARVTVCALEGTKDFSADARENFLRLGEIPVVPFSSIAAKSESFSVIIDAMLGTSFRGALRNVYRDAVVWCNAQRAMKVAVDIPTGLNGETGDVVDEAFRADCTVTLSNPKIGFYCGRAKEFTGDVIVADIGIPGTSIEKQAGDFFLTEQFDVRELMPRRPVNSHKHSVGKLFLLAGSRGMTGAALLASQSAMRTGAGQVILGIPDSEYPVVAKRTLEVMPFGLPSTTAGTIARAAQTVIENKTAWANVVAVGCGLSTNEETQEAVRSLVRRSVTPMVIDADGLNALSGHCALLKKRKAGTTIVTPHVGEFSRLINLPAASIERNKFALAKEFAREYGVILVLKGSPTIVAVPSGYLFINPTGNPGLSTAGSGDVLTGMIGALWGQGLSPEGAAVAGVYVHGMAGDLAAQKLGVPGMIASDIIRFIPQSIRTIKR